MFKFSVLMSVYKNDDAFFLKEALESIYEKQSRKPDEIIVVFDGPLTDALYDVLHDFRKNKTDMVFYYPQQENRGLGEALRFGAMLCTGDYIFRMDSDDISDEFRFEKQCEYIEEHPDIDVLGSNISEFYFSPDEVMRVRNCPEKHDDIVKMAKHRNPMNHVTVCMKRNSLLKCGNYESLMLLEDYYLWLKMMAGGCLFANINESLVYVRIGNGFNNKRSSKFRVSGWKTLQSYMVSQGIISPFTAFINMLLIRLFVWTPAKLKTFLYNKFLRK